MAAPKGHPKWGGRKKGAPNKSTVAVKAALLAAFEELGGVESLVAWGRENQTEFYRLWAKLLPVELKNAEGEALRLEIVEEIVTAAPRVRPESNGLAPHPA